MSNIPELLKRHSIIGEGISKDPNWGVTIYNPMLWMIKTRNITPPTDIDSTQNTFHHIRLFNKVQYRTIIIDDVVYDIPNQAFDCEDFKLVRLGGGNEVRTEIYIKKSGTHVIYFDFLEGNSGGEGRISNRNISTLRTPIEFNNNNKIAALIRTNDTSTSKIEFQSLIENINNVPFTIDTVFKCSAIKVPIGSRIDYVNSAKFNNVADSIIEEFAFTPIY